MLDYKELAKTLIKAEEFQYAVTCITDQFPEFDIAMGYLVQNELVKIKKEQGHERIALKMGLTSQAKMTQMNINDPIYGTVFDYMIVPDKGKILMKELIHPKVEAEIAFILKEDIEGPGVTGEEVLEKTEWVLPALEIIDSRFKDFKFKLPDVIADNTSASRVVFGNRLVRPKDFEINSINVNLSINGKLRASGLSAAVLGNPANSVAILANMLVGTPNGKIPKGTLVLTGGITEAILLGQGDHITARYEGMGDVSFSID